MMGLRFARGVPAWSEQEEAALELHAAKTKPAWQASEGVPVYLGDHYAPPDADAESCGGPCQCAQADANDYADRMQHDRDQAALAVCMSHHPTSMPLPPLRGVLAHDVTAHWADQTLHLAWWQDGRNHAARFDDTAMTTIRIALGVQR